MLIKFAGLVEPYHQAHPMSKKGPSEHAPYALVDKFQFNNCVSQLSKYVRSGPGRLKEMYILLSTLRVVNFQLKLAHALPHVRQEIPASRDIRCNTSRGPVGVLFLNLIRAVK